MTDNAAARTPFDPILLLGTVAEVHPDNVIVNLPAAVAPPEARARIRAAVGDFVFVECEQYAILGRVTETKLTLQQRLGVQSRVGKDPVDLDPLGKVQLLATWHLAKRELTRGLTVHPRLGDRVFLAGPSFLKHLGDAANAVSDPSAGAPFELGTVSISSAPPVMVTPKALVARHCCVLGATGGGKSWTVASLVEALTTANCRVIVFDPTGEFEDLPGRRLIVGQPRQVPTEAPIENDPEVVGFSYRNLTEEDLFVLLNPSAGIQRPKLRDAIRSLKLAQAVKASPPQTMPKQIQLMPNGCIKKEGTLKESYEELFKLYSRFVLSENCDFNISVLSQQLAYECVWDNGGTFKEPNERIWGGRNETHYNHCSNLVARLESFLASPELGFMFFPRAAASATNRIAEFAASDQNLLTIRLDNLSFQHSVREVCLNSFGRFLLGLARTGKFKAKPMIIVIDEAHQFLNKSVGQEDLSTKLDQFGLIAKEGRKYGLHVILATQRPRDIPDDVLSQIGTMIVHRLTNERDREVVEKACGQLDRSAAAFLPTLQQGEALLVGADFPLPVPVKIRRPSNPPKSSGSSFARPGPTPNVTPRPPTENTTSTSRGHAAAKKP